jgi:tetratricopeptide (TPR) repeat protein
MALEQMEKVVEMNPDDYATLDRLADAYRKAGMTQEAFAAYEKLSAHTPDNFAYLDYLLETGRSLGKSKQFRINVLNKMLKLQPENLRVVEQLAEETGSLTMLNRALKMDPRNGKLHYMKGDHYYGRWKDTGAQKDSISAMRSFERAAKDPQWKGNAQRMIHELDPPLTEEEKKLREFFKKKETKEEVKTEGKK